jgi:hypothetical protein
MWNPVEWYRQRRARRRFVPRKPRMGVGTTAKLSVVALLLILALAAVLEMRGGGTAQRALVPFAEATHVTPDELIATAGRRHRLIILGDVPGASAPKQLAARAVQVLVETSGLDALVVEIPADEQPYLDQYFLTRPEDPTILISRPRAVREAEGVSRDYLELYRTVWRTNEALGPDRAIRVIAGDLPSWPPSRGVAPNRAGSLYGQRDAFMAERVDSLLLTRNTRARALFFVDGLHTLRGGAALQSGGTGLVNITWLAQRLEERYPGDVYSIAVDASAGRVVPPDVVAWRRTGAYPVLRNGVPGAPRSFGLRVTDAFDPIGAPVHVAVMPGTTFTLQPGGRLRELVDGYIILN